VTRRPAATRRQAEIGREPDAVFRWWTSPARTEALRKHWEHLDVSDFTWHEDTLASGHLNAVEASWRTRAGIEVSVRRSFPPVERLRYSSHTVRQSRHPDGRLEVATSDMTVEFTELDATHTLVRLTNVWEAKGLRWWQRLAPVRYQRQEHINHHLKKSIKACLRDTEPGPRDNSKPQGE
jgi:hypothetical protein